MTPAGAAEALIVVDVQKGFEDPVMGPRNNPAAEENVAALIAAWRERGEPVVFVRHDSHEHGSPLAVGTPGNDFKDVVSGAPDLLVSKQVHSAFHGDPSLQAWLDERGIGAIAVCGIMTNFCCETTARVGCDLGYDVRFVIDATHTFDDEGPGGDTATADEISRFTAITLDGEFAQVVRTADVVAG